jgi:riboflavin kinase/FMN adenylyltransferase
MSGIGEHPLPGVANVGIRPTVAGGRTVLLETYLLDFSGDLYGKQVEIVFRHKLRDEKRFDGLAELQAQIERDVMTARGYFAISNSTSSSAS